VRVTFEESIAVRAFPKVAVAVPDGAAATPSTVDLTIRGPQRLLHNLTLPPETARVDVASLPPGSHVLPVQVTLPEGLKLVSQSPERVRVRIGGRS
jgi:YbbR domain-containing protein